MGERVRTPSCPDYLEQFRRSSHRGMPGFGVRPAKDEREEARLTGRPPVRLYEQVVVPLRKEEKGKGIPVFARKERRQADNCERSVWWAIARLATSRGLKSRREVTLMLIGSVLASVGRFFARLIGGGEGSDWH